MKEQLLKFATREISSECTSLCSTKKPSILQKCSVENIEDLSLEKICKEFQDQAPFFYSVMMTAGIPSTSRKKSCLWLPSVAAAGSILLKERFLLMNSFQILFMMCMKHCGIRTFVFYNKKCDEYGVRFDSNIKKVKEIDELILNPKDSKSKSSPTSYNLETACSELSSGFKLPFDNFDLHQKVRDMTGDNQNKDIHWVVNHNAVKNRISGNHIPDDISACDIANFDNERLLPNGVDHVMQRSNYIELVGRVITEEIPYLAFCNEVVTKHIPHPHSKETSKQTEKVAFF